jgi:signal transduction histidine kinase/CheY-like chemotaxis protein/HPt (histidine-containing phosphotransfer) domain-containing protein
MFGVKKVFQRLRTGRGHGHAATTSAPLRRSIVGLLALIVVIVGLLQVYLIANSFTKHVDEAERLAQTLVRVVEDQTNRSLQSVVLVLSATERELLPDGRIDSVVARARLRSVPEIRGLYLIGTDGRVTDSTISVADIGKDESGRDFIAELRETSAPVVVGKPILQRSPSGAAMPSLAYLPIAQRINQGKEILVAAVNISFLELQYRSLLGSTEAAVGLATFKGDVIVDSSRVWSPTTRIADADPIFKRFLPATEVATFRREAMMGRQSEIVSFRVTRAFSVVVNVSVTDRSVFDDWAKGALPSLVVTTAAFVLMLVALWHLKRQFQVIQEQEDSLVRSRDAAEAASRAKSQFLAVMSHEIRTPMNAVLGMASALLEERLQPEQRTSVQAIHDAGDSLLVILNDILDYTRLETGQLALEEIPFDPRSIIDRAAAIMGPRAQAKGLALEIIGNEALPAGVRGDAVRLTQVLLNVVGNAVKFTERGKVTVAVTKSEGSDGRVRLAWRVTDTGIGISNENIGALFRQFVQADASIHRRFGGSGLGLAICKKIIDQMQGEIYVTSEPGYGTTVIFTVPLEPADVALVPQAQHEGERERQLQQKIAARGKRVRVLVVDDNATNRVVAGKMLRSFDIDVEFADDGPEGVEKGSQSFYDLILMDMRMPNMDGPAATRLLRAGAGPNAGTCIVAFTANAFPEDMELCRAAGMDDVVPKPVRRRNLVAALLAALQRGPVAPHAPVEAVSSPPKAPEAVAFDRKVYADLEREIGEDTITEAMALFASEAQGRLQRMRGLDPARPADLDVIGREAHTLKGDAGSFGLLQAAAHALALEKAARGSVGSDYPQMLDELERALARGMAQVPRLVAAA